jgi:hypothetical protein
MSKMVQRVAFINGQLLPPPLGISGDGGGGDDAPGLVVHVCGPGEVRGSASLTSASIRSRARNTFDWR